MLTGEISPGEIAVCVVGPWQEHKNDIKAAESIAKQS